MKLSKLAAALAFGVLFTACSNKTQIEFQEDVACITDIQNSVTATGTVEPVTKVEVGTQVSGIIDKIYVDFNSVVHKGDIIAELDKTNLNSELASAQSNLANAQSNLDYQKANYDRYKTLFDKGLVSANDYEQARLSYEQARQQVIIQQQNVQKAKTNLGYATITAPIDGIVLSKEVEEGQTVASAMTTPTLFILAQDLTDMRVIAKVDEADIGDVHEGQRVTFNVDAFPEDVFEGVVTQVRQEATTESNVVTYEVVISAPNDDFKLKPGLTANVNIITSERNGVLAVPSKALRFRPSPELLGEEYTVEDTDAPGAKVWQLDGKTLRAINVTTGLQGGSYTEVLSGINDGQKVVTEMVVIGGDEENAEESSNPLMPSPPKSKNQKQGQGQGQGQGPAPK